MANAMAYLNEYLYNDLIGIVNNYLMQSKGQLKVYWHCMKHEFIFQYKDKNHCKFCKSLCIKNRRKIYQDYHRRCIAEYYRKDIEEMEIKKEKT
jgi:hypothetical protein